MDLLVAYRDDPAGYNMAEYLIRDMTSDGNVFCGKHFDVLVIDTPAISADWLEEKYTYDRFVFLSKHAAESGTLALTCHSTGNFADAKFGGNNKEIAVPYPAFQKSYMQRLWQHKDEYADFQITIEATHHGPTHLSKPSIFVEIGTTQEQWNNVSLCESVAKIVSDTIQSKTATYPFAICFGGSHYPVKFTDMLLHGKYALGTVMPRHALEFLDENLLDHILKQNHGASAILVDKKGLGSHKKKVLELLSTSSLEVLSL